MPDFKPSYPYNTAVELLVPSYSSVKGVKTKSFPDSGIRLNCSFKTYGGKEDFTNGVYTVIDTANVEMWFRPDVKSDCRIKLLSDGQIYEIVGKPENINQRNQFLRFRVKAVEGGA